MIPSPRRRGPERLRPALDYLESQLCEKVCLREAARRCGLSRSHFMRVFQRTLGVPVAEYVRRRRLSHAAEAVVSGRRVIEAALAWGYSSHSTFTRAFTRTFGVPPVVYARSVRAGDAPAALFSPSLPFEPCLEASTTAAPDQLRALTAV